MDPLTEKYAARAVPRYTSYPTVPHFTQAVGAARYGDWLAALDPDEPISLYLHVPYCRELCWYCGCNMKLAARPEPVAAYVETLIREIALVATHLPGRMCLSHLHWGGGTPTAMAPEALARAMAAVHLHFDIRDGAEIAIESDPRSLSDAMIARIGGLGFTRASFGVQEFDPRVQAAINRIQPPEMVAAAVEGLGAAGVAGINFDLIYGLPHQTVESLLNTITLCHSMAPDRLALFGYAHVPWMAKNQRLIDEAALPGPDARAAQARAAAERLGALGYQAIGLDHFARPDDPLAVAARTGRLRRNFQGYTTDRAQTLIGLGATSIGRTPQGFVQNLAETRAWARSVTEGTLPVGKGHCFSGDDLVRGDVIGQIMCAGAVDLSAAGETAGLPRAWWRQAEPTLRDLAADGVLELTPDGHLTLTEAGRPFSRVAAAAFDRYLAPNIARHSVAV